MGRRGPNPVDNRLLQMYASDWSVFLHMLRDGREAELHKVTRSERVENQNGREIRIPVTKHMRVAKFGPESTDARLLVKKSLRNPKDGEWLVKPPVIPAPKVWEQFKQAHSPAEVEQVLNLMEKHVPEADRGLLVPLFKAARGHAADIFNAKENLPHYPGSDRPGSDNKRIDFFAKILAGFALGLSPLTTTKRLAWWSPTMSLYSAELSRERKKK